LNTEAFRQLRRTLSRARAQNAYDGAAASSQATEVVLGNGAGPQNRHTNGRVFHRPVLKP
jgi:hypothetical protein